MLTTKNRLNISLPVSMRTALAKLAKRDQMPQATKAAKLLEVALELEEDQVWDILAARRDTAKARYFSHSKVWR